MTNVRNQADQSDASYKDRISRETFEQLVHIRGEGDEWDFKLTLGSLTQTAERVNLAKDALAFCNLPDGGTLVIGVAKDYTRVGLQPGEVIDTTEIRRAIEKYIDGDFIVLAADHLLAEEGESEQKRYGIIYLRRRATQPLLAAQDGQITNDKAPLFRSGDILIRRGAASIRANSGDVRRLLTSTVVHQERVRAVNELWTCMVEQRRLLSSIQYLYDLLVDTEYKEVHSNPNLRAALGKMSESDHASSMEKLGHRVNLVRPHIPEQLYQQYRSWSAIVGRIQMKAIRQRDSGIFVSWTDLDNGTPDQHLRNLASELLRSDQIDALWAGVSTNLGTYRPLKPAIDATEQGLLEIIRRVLSGLT